MYKVEIFQKKESFLNDLLAFLLEKSPNFKRDFSIDNILNQHSPPIYGTEYLKNISKFDLENVFGSTFQSYYRSNDNIYAISHTISSIIYEDSKFYGIIVPSTYGDVIDFTKGILQPVYYKNKEESDWKIATFDISFNIIDNAA